MIQSIISPVEWPRGGVAFGGPAPLFLTFLSPFRFLGDLMSGRVGIFIDGGYLHVIVKNVFSVIDHDFWGTEEADPPIDKYFPESKIDYRKLALKMAAGEEIAHLGYYTASPFKHPRKPTKGQKKRRKAYNQFKGYLNDDGFAVQEGYLAERPVPSRKEGVLTYDIEFEQKGVDTFIAWDMANVIAKKRISRICLLTGDSDFFLSRAMC